MYVKRLLDLSIAIAGLAALLPILLVTALIIFFLDGRSPIFVSKRAGKNGKAFDMLKFRTMRFSSNSAGPSSTAIDDFRITRVGAILRRFKIDETLQLLNVIRGEMSLVGPRPQVTWAVESYSPMEQLMLAVRPGITDIASIVYADEATILRGSGNPDADYDTLIRPGKSQLGLFYVENRSCYFDVSILALTVIGIIDRNRSLNYLLNLLTRREAPEDLRQLVRASIARNRHN